MKLSTDQKATAIGEVLARALRNANIADELLTKLHSPCGRIHPDGLLAFAEIAKGLTSATRRLELDGDVLALVLVGLECPHGRGCNCS
jgi:hypothetical protein